MGLSQSTKLRIQAQNMAGPKPELGGYAYAGGATQAKQAWATKVEQNLAQLQTTQGGGVAPATSEAMKKAMEHYQPGGGFGGGTEAALERGRVKSLASGGQALVGAGLAETTMLAGLGKKYEEEVAAPTWAGVEETRAQALSGLEMMKAQIIQGATESARSNALQQYLAQLQSQTSLSLGSMRSGPSVSAPAQQPIAPTAPRQTGGQLSTYGQGYSTGSGKTTGDESAKTSHVARGYGPMFGDTGSGLSTENLASYAREKWLAPGAMQF